MPFIRGRYHINPVLGEALEAARQAEAALLALENEAQEGEGESGDSDAEPSTDDRPNPDIKGPIHRVEIEAAEMVPSHSGRAARGFVARVHRDPVQDDAAQHAAASSSEHRFVSHNSSGAPMRGASPQPETHVFSDHRDLVNFLRDELARDCKKRTGK